jgi:hypothetical protein
MGPVLWWWWEEAGNGLPGRWAGEPPYVGTPLDAGFELLVQTETTIATSRGAVLHPIVSEKRVHVGGWPGYHTHFTLIPMPEAPKHDRSPQADQPQAQEGQIQAPSPGIIGAP